MMFTPKNMFFFFPIWGSNSSTSPLSPTPMT